MLQHQWHWNPPVRHCRYVPGSCLRPALKKAIRVRSRRKCATAGRLINHFHPLPPATFLQFPFFTLSFTRRQKKAAILLRLILELDCDCTKVSTAAAWPLLSGGCRTMANTRPNAAAPTPPTFTKTTKTQTLRNVRRRRQET